MFTVIRAALPGYDALTDTNPDHYSLYTDVNNVIVKEYSSGTTFISAQGSINHGLGYIPSFSAFAPDPLGTTLDNFIQIGHAGFFIDYGAYIGTNNLTIYNFVGSSNPIPYFIFYDFFTPGTPSFSPSGEVLAVSSPGYDAKTETNPNNFVFHSDLVTPQIIYEGGTTLSISGSGGTVAFNHGASISVPHAFKAFIKFPDNSATFLSYQTNNSRNGTYSCSETLISNTQIKSRIQSVGTTNFNVDIKYYIFNQPLVGTVGGTINLSDHKIRVAKTGYDAETETDYVNYKFLSGFNTLKYFDFGTTSLSIPGTSGGTVNGTIAHNLGYYPYVDCFVNDNSFGIEYNTIPYNVTSFAFQNYASACWDDNNLYFNFKYTGTASRTSLFSYKLFKNDLSF